jgi:Uma2 family endonuclease
MATTKATKLYTAEDLWEMGDDARAELIEGELIEMGSPNPEHGTIQINIGGEIRNHIRRHRLPVSVSGDAGLILSRNPDTVLLPDISVLDDSRLPPKGQRKRFQPTPPTIAVEIISPSNRPSEIRRKMAAYLGAGTSIIWIVDPDRKIVTVHRADGTSQVLREADGDFLDGEDILPEFRMVLSDVFDA